MFRPGMFLDVRDFLKRNNKQQTNNKQTTNKQPTNNKRHNKQTTNQQQTAPRCSDFVIAKCMCPVPPATSTAAATTTTTTSTTNTTTTTAATITTATTTTTTTSMKSTMTSIFRDRMSVYNAVGLGRADSDEERELRNVSARRAKERRRLRFTEFARRRSPMPPLVSKLRSVTVGKDDVILVSAAS